MMDSDIVKKLFSNNEKTRNGIKKKTKVVGVKATKKGATIELNGRDDDKSEKIECDKVLIAVGRKLFTDELGLENVGITTNKHGFIEVDKNFKHLLIMYAIGDVIGGAMLAHKAEEEGVACVEQLSGLRAHVNYNAIPSVVYTHPEVASVGKTEQEIKEQKIEYNVGKFSFIANSRGRAVGETDGLVKKVITEKKPIKYQVFILWVTKLVQSYTKL